MQQKPWIPAELKKYPRARKVLGVLASKEPNDLQFKDLHREKVIGLIKKAKSLEPIATYLNLPLSSLNNPKDPEAVYQDMEDLAPDWRRPVHELIMYLKTKKKADLQEIFKTLDLGNDREQTLKGFQRELFELTLEEFLELAT